MEKSFGWFAGVVFVMPTFAWAGETAPVRTWFGTIQDTTLRKFAPPERFLTNARDFEKLWKAWKPADLVPPVDFGKYVLLVRTEEGRKIDRFHLKLDAKKDLAVLLGYSDHKDFPGFTFGMAEVPRDRILSIEGRPLKKVARHAKDQEPLD